jgi:hypothetical protein
VEIKIMGYNGLINIIQIGDVRIGDIYWIDEEDLGWTPGQKMATTDPTHPPMIGIVVRTVSQVFRRDEMPDVVSKLRSAAEDVNLGEVIIP